MAIVDLTPPVGSPPGRGIFRWLQTDAADWVEVRPPEDVPRLTLRPIGGTGYVSHTESGAFSDVVKSSTMYLLY